jgi:hypothetical protein
MLVFIDESGDSGLKIEKGSSRYFTIALVVFEDNDEAVACDQRIELLKRELAWNPKSEFHFKNNSDKVRKGFLHAVSPYNFFYYGVVLNKDPKKLWGDGFRDKKSFYKYACGLVFENAKPKLTEATVVIDESGSLDFRKQLTTYLRRKLNEQFQGKPRAVIEVDVPTDASTDTPVSVTDVPTDNASSTQVSEPVDAPAPVEDTSAPIAPVDAAPVEAPVVVSPVLEPAPPVVQSAPAPQEDKFIQNQSLWRQLLQKSAAVRKQRQFNNIAKVYQFILQRKHATDRDVQLFLLCRTATAQSYLDALIAQNQIKRVGETHSSKAYYVPVS